jgi:hypothetical protein
MEKIIPEIANTNISEIFLKTGGLRTAPLRARRMRSRSFVLPVAAAAAVMTIGLALLPVAFVAVDHDRVVTWTNRLFDMAGL